MFWSSKKKNSTTNIVHSETSSIRYSLLIRNFEVWIKVEWLQSKCWLIDGIGDGLLLLIGPLVVMRRDCPIRLVHQSTAMQMSVNSASIIQLSIYLRDKYLLAFTSFGCRLTGWSVAMTTVSNCLSIIKGFAMMVSPFRIWLVTSDNWRQTKLGVSIWILFHSHFQISELDFFLDSIKSNGSSASTKSKSWESISILRFFRQAN